jgi:ribosomal protein S18 acetylase RimI-like enzyme
VPPPVTRPFAEGDLDAAAALLAERHRQHRLREPALAERFEDAAAARLAIEEGRRRQYVLVPAGDEATIAAWFRLSFGHQQSHAVLEPAEREPELAEGLSIRTPTVNDIDRLVGVDVELPRHQRLSPVFSELSLPTPEESRAEWEQTLADDYEHVLVGFDRDRPVACWSMVPWKSSSHATGPMMVDDAAFLGFAVTVPDARGSGIGRAMTDACLTWAAREGYAHVVTDWRETNLLASRFWPTRGFRRSFLRLYRSIP